MQTAATLDEFLAACRAALALATAVELRRQGWLISTDAMHEGLGDLTLPARVEVLGRQPTVVLDVAHNVASAQALVKVFSFYPTLHYCYFLKPVIFIQPAVI